jgi:hypothetical protein
MRYLVLFLTFISVSVFAKNSCPDYKAVVCHAGSEVNPHFVEICVSFSSLYGHLAEHEMDYYGPCRLRNIKAPYACNAGMRQKDSAGVICIQRDGDETKYVSSCGDSKNCYCSGPSDQYLFDFFRVDLVDFNPFTEEETNPLTKNIQAGKDRFKAATNSPASTKIVTEGGLSFNLGSERMHGEYFVDMCWMNTTGSEQYDLDFSVQSNIIANTDNGIPYPLVTDLKSKYHVFCDYDFDGVANYDSLSHVQTSTEVPFQVGSIASYDFNVSNAEFCIVRQSFKEMMPEVMRPWDLKKIVVQNNLEIDVPPYNDGPINICHVQEITNGGGPGGNNGTNHSYGPHIAAVTVGIPFQTINKKKIHECTQLQFRDSDHLKEYIKHGKDNKEFRDIHQHDYVGTCRSTCGPIHGNGAN